MSPPRPLPDWRQLRAIEQTALAMLAEHARRRGQRLVIMRAGPDAVFGDLSDRARGKPRQRRERQA